MPDAEPFESPLETLSDGVWLLEADGRLAAANRAFAALLDPAAETPARGTSWKDLAELLGRFGRCHSGGVEIPIDSLFREGSRRPIACDYRRRDGGGLALSAGPDPRGGLMLVLAEPPAERGELRATRLLRQSQANLAAAQRIAKLGSWEFDLVDLGNIDANPLRWSDETFRIFGYEPGGVAVSNESYLRAVHADDRQRVRETLEKSVAQGTGYDIEYRIVRPNGAEVVVHERSDILRDPRTGSVTKMVGTTQDITERKRIELALKHARDRAQQYLDVAAVIFAVLNPEHTVAMLNRKGLEILGVSEQQAIGQNWFDAFAPPADRERQRAAFAAFLTGRLGHAEDTEKTIRTSRGEIRLIAWHNTLLRDESDAIIGVLSSGEDITGRRAAEHDRDEFHTLLEATAQASPDGLLVTDLRGRHLFWNHRYKEMWGLAEDHLDLQRSVTKATPELLEPLSRQVIAPETFIARTMDMYGGAVPALVGDELQLTSGRILVRFAARVAAGSPPIAAIAWIYRDVTDERKREAELAQTQRLAAVAQLSGGVAHELNNLLTVIYGNLELIQATVPEQPQVTQLVEPAIGAVHRGAELTQSLLAYSRQQPLAPQLTDVNALVAGIMKLLPPLLGTSIDLRFESGEDLWPIVVDPGRLQMTLMNLATNARDAMPQGGTIVIATRNVDLGDVSVPSAEAGRGEHVKITVTDEGLGMPPEVADRAFEPFFTTKGVGKGTGLGLSMVFGFVKQSGGQVSLDSREGQGTTVSIYLPRAPEWPAAPSARAPLQLGEGRHETILLVEDLPAVREVTRSLLDSLGYRVIEAAGGPDAVGILQGGAPVDLLLTDVMLPDGMNGTEVAKAARLLRPGLKVLFFSGYSEQALGELGQLDPGSALLQKPYRRQDLTQAIRRLLSS